MLGVGVDILALDRVTQLLLRRPQSPRRFAERILSPLEYQVYTERFGTARPRHGPSHEEVIYLASRFCVKEAAYKSLFPHVQLTWKDLSLSKVHEVKPSLELINPSLLASLIQNYAFRSFQVSISHDAGLIMAIVLAT